MIPRYSRPEMARIWESENKFRIMLEIETLAAEKMEEMLGVTPGAVTAFGIINDRQGALTFAIDQRLLEHEKINCHPLVNTATTAISREDFRRFVEATGHFLTEVDFSGL